MRHISASVQHMRFNLRFKNEYAPLLPIVTGFRGKTVPVVGPTTGIGTSMGHGCINKCVLRGLKGRAPIRIRSMGKKWDTELKKETFESKLVWCPFCCLNIGL